MPEEEGIYLETKPASGQEIHKGFHSYLVYRDGKGNARVIRGGSDSIFSFDGNVEVQNDIDLQDSDDAYKSGETMENRHAVKLDLKGRSSTEVWENMKKRARKIHERKFDYDAKPRHQNSNSVTRALLDAEGIPFKSFLPQGFEVDDYPGIENDLSQPERHSYRNLLQEPVENWSEADVKAVMNSDAYNTPGDSQRNLAQEKVRHWFVGEFGAGPQAVDATGRPLPSGEVPRKSRGRPQRGSGTVHVRSHSREGGEVHIGAYNRSRPT